MDHLGLESSLEILQISKDDVGPFTKIQVTLVDKQLVIRWGLDEYTYTNLNKLISNLFPDEFPNENYRCFLSQDSKDALHSEDVGWLICHFGAQKTRLYFQCSDLYKSNLLWLQSVENIEELEHLSWNGWIESYFTFPTSETTCVIDHTETDKHFLRYAIILMIACIIASAGWFGISLARHLIAKHAQSTKSFSAALTSNTATAVNRPNTQNHPPQVYSLENHVPTDTASSDSAKNLAANSANQGRDDRPSTFNPINPEATTCPEVYKLPAGNVALTFDDGPSPYTNEILQILAANHIHATFFFVGTNVEKWPGAVQRAAMLGNEIEDHSVDHGNLATMSSSQQKWEIENAAKEIENLTNKPVTLFRPPYESFNGTTRSILGQDGMALALWNRDTEDWKATSPEQVVHSVLSQPASGSIFLLHDKLNTMLALPAIIKGLQSENLQFVVVPAADLKSGA